MSGAATPPPPWRGETYHGRPVVKASSFDWKVSTYILLLGIAGAAQVIGAVAREPGLVRRARLLALGGATIGPLVLIRHLKTPARWANMLRIFRATSPMSLGSWLLTVFGGLTGLTALGAFFGHRSPFAARVADAAQGPAAIAGAGMGVYTAALLSSTSTPLWAAAPAPLGAQFGAASMAGAAAALALLERRAGEIDSAQRLEALATLAAAGELAAGLVAERRWRARGVEHAATRGRAAPLLQLGAKGLGVAVPVLTQAALRLLPAAAAATARAAPRLLPELASIAILLGGAALRHGVLLAGNESARHPRDAFRAAQPGTPAP